jgi:hypothetical protein
VRFSCVVIKVHGILNVNSTDSSAQQLIIKEASAVRLRQKYISSIEAECVRKMSIVFTSCVQNAHKFIYSLSQQYVTMLCVDLHLRQMLLHCCCCCVSLR